MTLFKKVTNEEWILALILILGVGTLESLGVTCPIKFLTGVSCPGCGMTRAWISFLTLHIHKAFYYHPLFLMPLALPPIMLAGDRISEKVQVVLYIIMAVALIVCYVWRMGDLSQSVVVFHVSDGLFYKMAVAGLQLAQRLF